MLRISKIMAEISPKSYNLNHSGSVNGEKTQKKEYEMAPGAFLGLDYGKAKVGLATADEETRMAFAFGTLKNDSEFLKKLKEIVGSENVKTIVLGMVEHEKDQKSAEEKKKFARILETKLGLEVVFQDEMFTTKMAQDNIKKRGGKNIAKTDDQEAARIILQSWLDNRA